MKSQTTVLKQTYIKKNVKKSRLLNLGVNNLINIQGRETRKSLWTLQIINNPISDLEGIHVLKYLTDLDISNCDIYDTPDLSSLPNLDHVSDFNSKRFLDELKKKYI